MIADTTFVSDLIKERQPGHHGAKPATELFYRARAAKIHLTIITAGEISVAFKDATAARAWLDDWQIYPLHFGIMDTAADIDREMIRRGRRLGENDNWIAGFVRYHRQPLISRDKAFDSVAGIRRVKY